ncbi:MAG: hypothetical protein JXJ04_04020, partial [Spirochaetales bacterium]|nr:hypothetical protein [Spirochaetales bacterium]
MLKKILNLLLVGLALAGCSQIMEEGARDSSVQSDMEVYEIIENPESIPTSRYYDDWLELYKHGNCTPPVTYYYNRYFQSNLGAYKWSDGSGMNDSISTIVVPSGYESVIFEHAGYKGKMYILSANFPGGYWEMGGMNDKVSSLVYYKINSNWRSYHYLSNYPHEASTSYSHECQGVTHDDNYWYISSRFHIHKILLTSSLYDSGEIIAARPYHGSTKIVPSPTYPGYANINTHIGDIDYYNGEIYAPIEDLLIHSEYNGREQIYAYNANKDNGTTPVRWGFLKQQNRASWVAINPLDGYVYSSKNNDTNILYAYDRNFGKGTDLWPVKTIYLDMQINAQGGCFDPEGYLYLTASDPGGIFVFKLSGNQGILVRTIELNGYQPGGTSGEETEGITWWDLDSRYRFSSLEGG